MKQINIILFYIVLTFTSILTIDEENFDEKSGQYPLADSLTFDRQAIFTQNNSIIIEKDQSKESTNESLYADDKIVGGIGAHLKRYKYQVAVLSKNLCGGSLLTWRWVVTAQHCVAGLRAKDLKIHAGSRQYNRAGVIALVNLIIKYPRYNPSTLNNDIALLRMPIGFFSFRLRFPIKPIKLSRNVPSVGTRCVVSGFGTLSSNGRLPKYLQKVVVRIVDKKRCNRSYNNQLTKNMLCAGYFAGGKDACQGDSGGPLVCNKKLVGIVSFGNGCAMKNFPGVYTNVPEYIAWIKRNIK